MNPIARGCRKHPLHTILCVTALSAAALILSGAAAPARAAGGPQPASNAGPVRLCRFSIVDGDVNWRPDDKVGWSRAVRNLPIRQGCEVALTGRSDAEVQFDDGSRLKLGNGAVVTLSTLYSDADGEFTQIALRTGTLSLRINKAPSVYEVDGPVCSVDASGPARFRIDATNGEQVRVREGKVVMKGDHGECSLIADNYVDLPTATSPYAVRALPPHDAYDNWEARLYARENRYLASHHRTFLPSDVALVSDDLDLYGDWRYDRHYGRIWHPRVRYANWRPYHDGRWVWCDPYGWTWVDDEPWGWAPCHYGTWVHESYGWCWDPGPAHQYWCPAVVDTCDYDGDVAWCALSPAEVRYPAAISIGFRGGDWSAFFSIGGACDYYPVSAGYCEPWAWSNSYCNSASFVDFSVRFNNYYGGGFGRRDGFHGFVPANARFAGGGSFATVSAFGGRGAFQGLPRDRSGVFSRGLTATAPAAGAIGFAGPRSVRPTTAAMTATRSFRSGDPVSRATLSRPVRAAAAGAGSFATARQLVARPPAQAGRFNGGAGARMGAAGAAGAAAAGALAGRAR
ncbi:MAG TPA: FecR family protein, partial [Chthonomonadaceae bacterium]|nr:FecR family protein [Chthonomonadaceae bacterium]